MSKVDPVTDFDSAKKCWDQTFISTDPYIWPFHERVKDYIFIYPTDGFALNEQQYRAIIQTANKIQDSTFYLSVVEAEEDIFREKDILDRNIHWLCENPDFKEYLSIVTIPLECGLYSKGGNWGMLISQDMHALVGGTTVFIDELKKEYPDWINDRERMFHDWKNNPAEFGDAGWLKNFD